MNLMNKLVSKNLLLNKKRSIVTVIGIILSASLLVALAGLVTSFQKSLVVFEKTNGGDYHLELCGVQPEDLDTIAGNRKIESFYRTMQLGYAEFPESKNSTKPYLRVVDIDRENLEAAGIRLIQGRLPENPTEAVIPAHIRTNARAVINIGDTLNLELGRRVIAGEDGSFTELAPDTGYQNYGASYTSGYVSDERGEKIIDRVGKTYTVVGIIERCPTSIEPYICPAYTLITCGESMEGQRTDVYARLTKEGLKNAPGVAAGIMGLDPDMVERVWNNDNATEQDYQDFYSGIDSAPFGLAVNSWLIQYERVWPIDSSLMVVFALGTIVALIIIVTSVYCIKNSFEISISEKIRQYGMLASIGATSRQIKKSVHTEAAILGAIGIPFGIIFGNLAAFILIKVCNWLLVDSLNINLIFGPALWGNALAVFLGAITIYLSAQRSARKAGKISPMEAIRNQKEIKLNAKKLKIPGFIEKIWGIGGVISYKNIKRNRRKYRTTTVSIVICTVTFIVISYFTSMLFTMVGLAYSEEKSNISTRIHNSDDYKTVNNVVRSLDNVDEYAVIICESIGNIGLEWSPEQREYQEYLGLSKENDHLLTLFMNDESYIKYTESIGASQRAEGVILVNTHKFKMIFEDDSEKSGEIEKYIVKNGDIMSFSMTQEMYDEETDKSEVKTFELPVIDVTDDRPLGYMGAMSDAFAVIRMSTAKNMGLLSENNPNRTVDVFCVSSNPDKLQEDLEKSLEAALPDAEFFVNNSEASRRAEKSLFTMLAIFAYGLIAVIALIGITNIVNTLNTGMELRAREFATLRSVGMTDSQFNRMVRLESLFTAGKSLIIGNVLGLAISWLINRAETTFDRAIIFRPPYMACTISIVVVMLLIYTIISTAMNRINRRNIIETIKNENL